MACSHAAKSEDIGSVGAAITSEIGSVGDLVQKMLEEQYKHNSKMERYAKTQATALDTLAKLATRWFEAEYPEEKEKEDEGQR